MIPQDPGAREEYRKRRLAHYNILAREIWGDRGIAEQRMHVFAMATFGQDAMDDDGNPTIKNVPLVDWHDMLMVNWLNQVRNAMRRFDGGNCDHKAGVVRGRSNAAGDNQCDQKEGEGAIQ